MIKAKRNRTTARSATLLTIGLSCWSLIVPASSLAQTVGTQDPSAGSITELQLPRVNDYWVSATRQPGGAIIFDGYAPDEKLRTKLSLHPQADTQFLRLGSGAPDRYTEAVNFGLSILDRLSEGRFALRDNVVTLNGIAQTQEDFLELTGSIASGTPQGLVLARSEILAPRADTYHLTAQKNADGSVVLGGLVPDPMIEKVLVASAGASARANFDFASGNPDNFQSSAQTGIALLSRFKEGQVNFDGKAWTLIGTANSPADKDAIEADFTRQKLAQLGWSMAVSAPEQSNASPSVAVNPEYAFSVTKPESGTIIFSGQLPAEPALRFFGAITNGNIDAVSIAGGAPPDFVMQAETGVRALMLLDEGALDYAQGKWSLSGTASDEPSRDAAMAALGDASSENWETEISLVATANPVAPVAPAEPVAVATAPAAVQGTSTTASTCETPLAEFSARNAIRFRSGAAVITPESAPALDELATDLAACPSAPVHVEGHTDADGDEQLNLALSVARAEAVVNALIERGVAPARLYALGYGESSPIGDNTTAEGKELNRRIVVKVGTEP